MSKMKNLFNSAGGAVDVATNAARSWDNLPLLRELLVGDYTSDASGTGMPALSITFWLEGDYLKFCASKKGYERKLFGATRDAADGLLSIEKALERGDFEIKRMR